MNMSRKITWLLILFSSIATLSMSAMTEKERREYLEWMQKNMPQVEEFTAWQQKTGELPPDFDALPKSNLLPDPFTFLDGTPVGPGEAAWEKRRAEILSLFEKYVTGSFPAKPELGRVEVLDETKSGDYIVRNVKLWYGPQNKASVRVRVVIPDGEKGAKYPVLLAPSLAGWGNTVLRRGYISAGYAGGDFMDDAAQLVELYPDHDFSKLSRRAWMAHVVIDYLVSLPEVNDEQIAMFGYSRDGKMAMIAAALDTRISALLAGSTGVGGVVPWRMAGERGGGESIETTTRMFPDWYHPRFRYFSGHEDRLPVDANSLLALIAPRAVLMEWGYNDEVANGWAQEQTYKAALKVYERFGKPENLQILRVPGFHGSNDQDACVDFLDIVYGRSDNEWKYEPVFPWSFEQWKAESGVSVDASKYAKYDAKRPIAKSLSQWNGKAQEIKSAINEMLGEAPAVLPPSTESTGGFRFSFRRPGPTEVALGKTGNPGQLAPDVHAWVISRGGMEFGWLEPEKNQVESRRVTFSHDNQTADLYYPAGTAEDAKLPTVIWLHGHHFPLGYMWVYRQDLHPILALVKAGFAVLAFDQTGYGMRTDENAPFYDRYPQWSRFGRMVEDVQSAVTALQKEKMVDGEQISVLGFTLGGAVGLHAAAMDDRIKQVVSVCGFTPFRADKVENGLSGMTRYSHVYGLIPRLGFFAENQDRVPYDYDDVISLVAPRRVLVVQNSFDRDADPQAVREAVERAGGVYKLYDAEEKLTLMEPYDYGRMPAATQDKIIEWLKANQ